LWKRVLLPVLVVATGAASYWNSFAGAFLFDDRLHILGHRRLSSLWPLGETLARRRPVADYSLAVDYAVFGEQPWGYHTVNVTVHLLAASTLYGIVRRTLLSRRPGDQVSSDGLLSPSGVGASSVSPPFGGNEASWLALVVALIWVVHPLQTQSVTYLVQRAESFMGLFYLLTMYCVIRGAVSSESAAGQWRAVAWHAAAVGACALGMGSKAVMVTAPVMVLVYDRTFLSGSAVQALRQRWGLYAGLAATWGVTWSTGVVRGVLDPSARGAHVGFGFKDITPVEYAFTQFGVLVEYLRLSVWPVPLCLDYAWPVADTVTSIAMPAALILPLLAATLWFVFHRPWLGFLGLWFFLILAPTSSFIPIKDVMFEHRMYLPLAAIVVLLVVGGFCVLRNLSVRLSARRVASRFLAILLVAFALASLIAGTVSRNRVYHSEVGMWRDVLTKRPHSSRAAENLGTIMLGEGKPDEALSILRSAVEMAPGSATAHNALGFALVGRGELEEAMICFREALQLRPAFARAHLNLGNALNEIGRSAEAIEHFRAAVRIRPGYTEARLNLGNALLTQGQIEEAITEYREIIRIEPGHASAWGNLGFALLNRRPLSEAALDEAVKSLWTALDINPAAHNARNTLGIALATQGNTEAAIAAFRQTLAYKPDFPGAHFNLAGCLRERGDVPGAILHYRAALQGNPSDASAHFALGEALVDVGDLAAAIEHFRATLRINPAHAEARNALEAALARQTGSTND